MSELTMKVIDAEVAMWRRSVRLLQKSIERQLCLTQVPSVRASMERLLHALKVEGGDDQWRT